MIRIFILLSFIYFLTSNISYPSSFYLLDPRYHTYEEMAQEVDSIARMYPEITRLDTLGVSTRDSLPILAIKISDNPSIKEDEPAILFNGVHHAEELLGGEVALYLLNDLVSRYGIDSAITGWIDNTEIWIIPILNPEGHNVVTSGLDTIWRKNKRDNNNSGFFEPESDGVDLNRNYDFNWELGGSPDPTSEYYRGPYPFSESETRIIRDLALENHFVFDVCYHNVRTGQGELVYWPWRWGTQFCIDYPFIKKIADTLASKIINDAGNGTYASIYGYATEGTARNWLYGVGGTFAYTIEVSRSCYPPGYLVDSICIRNLPGAYYLLERAFGSGITGTITDSITNQPLVAEVRVSGFYDSTLPPRMSDSIFGRYRRILNPGTYTLYFIKSGYDTVIVEGVVVEPGFPETLNIKMQPLGIEETDLRITPYALHSLKIYPNPFRNRLTIHYALSTMDYAENRVASSQKSVASIKIYDATGRLVRNFSRLTTCDLLSTQIVWDGSDDLGQKIPAGVYFIFLKAAGSVGMAKVLKID